MANMEERLQAVVSQAEADGEKWHIIIHGNNATTVPTENGNVPTVAKQMKDVHDEVVNGVIDYMTECQTARDVAIQTKNETIAVKNETNTIKGDVTTLRNETESLKNQSQTVFNNIATATSSAVQTVQIEGATQVTNVQSAVAEQVAEATSQANRAEQATSTKVNTDLSNITKDTISSDFAKVVEEQAVKREYNSILRPRVSYLEKIDTKNTMVYFVDALGVEYLSFILAQCNSNNLFANVTVCRSELPSITCMNKEFVDVFSSAGCKIIDIKDLDELKHHGTNDFDYQITKEPIHLIEELNIIATVLEKIRTNIASGKCEKAIIISDHGASRLAVINETENKYEMSEKGEHSGRCCPVSDIDEKPDFATEENGYWVLANYDRFKGGRKANVEVHGGAALEEVCVPIIEITPQNEKIDVRLLDSYKNITVSFRKSALIKFFINKKLNNLKVKIEGKYYDAQPTAEEFVYQVSMPDIRKAKNYIFDVYASENMIASGLQFNVKSEVTVEKDLF